MTLIAAIAIVSLAILLLAREREASRERKAFQDERRSLADRIQHPEVRQVEAVHREPADPPRDGAELAQVGLEVPEFVQVGENHKEN